MWDSCGRKRVFGTWDWLCCLQSCFCWDHCSSPSRLPKDQNILNPPQSSLTARPEGLPISLPFKRYLGHRLPSDRVFKMLFVCKNVKMKRSQQRFCPRERIDDYERKPRSKQPIMTKPSLSTQFEVTMGPLALPFMIPWRPCCGHAISHVPFVWTRNTQNKMLRLSFEVDVIISMKRWFWMLATLAWRSKPIPTKFLS